MTFSRRARGKRGATGAGLVLFAMVGLAPLPSLGDTPDGAWAEAYFKSGGDMPACGLCHTLAEAGTRGTIGPNLDDLQPTPEEIALALRDGVGVMPVYGEGFDEDQIAAMTEYVAAAIAE